MNRSGNLAFETLATRPAGSHQKFAGAVVCIAFAIATAAMMPIVGSPIPSTPGFIALNQSVLIVVYALTTYLLFAQYARARTGSLLVLATGSLYTTLIVFAQLLTFPNLLVAGRLVGSSPATTTWLWSLWHIGPPLAALGYALLYRREERAQSPASSPSQARRLGWLWSVAAATSVFLATLVVTRYLPYLPKQVESDGSYWPLTTSGVGPGIVALTVLALVVLWRTTRLRTMLQVWLAVSLFVLVLDNLVTLPGAARDTVGWFAGRIEALVAGLLLLGALLWEIDLLYQKAETMAVEREKERNELQLARDNLAIALDASGMGDWELDLVTGMSRRTLRHDQIFGYDRLLPEWGLDDFSKHVVAEDRATVASGFSEAARTGRLDVVCRIKPADGGPVRWIAILGKTYFDEAGAPRKMAGVVMDTTQRHEMDERLNRAQRMEAIGQLTGGVAHDFNNLLTVVVGNFDMISRKPGDIGRVERLAASGLLAARRGAELTEKLLAFSRRQPVRPETVNANRLIQDFLPLLQRGAGEAIALKLDLDPALDPVRIDRGQFEAALLNLIVNAHDALPNGGEITISSRGVAGGETGAGDADLGAERYVRVTVEDTGPGMDEATRSKAFEPFFTTKDVGKGTGLGLSQVYGFARQAGGHARIRSASGAGTAVDLFLPPSSERVQPSVHKATPAEFLRQATDGEVILVVEDEPAVLEMAVESLSELGDKTLTAIDAASALAKLKVEDRIDILFSDVIMPGGMNGLQLAVEARRIRPGLKVLLASGYTASALGDQHAVPDNVLLLKKPYMREELAATLRVVMRA